MNFKDKSASEIKYKLVMDLLRIPVLVDPIHSLSVKFCMSHFK